MNRVVNSVGILQRTLLLPHVRTTQQRLPASNIPKPPVADAETIFDKIIRKQIPADVIYEDEKCLAFNDVSPQGPVHFLVIPKRRIPKLEDGISTDESIFGHLMRVAGQLGKEKAPQGFRLVINNGEHGCQTVYHLHLHVIGGRQLGWPPG